MGIHQGIYQGIPRYYHDKIHDHQECVMQFIQRAFRVHESLVAIHIQLAIECSDSGHEEVLNSWPLQVEFKV